VRLLQGDANIFISVTAYGYLSIVLPGYMVLTQAMKGFYTRKYGWL
jgi:hypothetical protein